MINPRKLEIIKDLKAHLQQHYPVAEVILFGSQARNEETEDSDYDVLIIINQAYNWKDERNIYDVCWDIDYKYDVLIDAHILSNAELSTLRGRQPIYSDAMEKGVYA